MTDDLKMYIALGVFMLLPIVIMGVALATDWIDRKVNRPRPTDR